MSYPDITLTAPRCPPSQYRLAFLQGMIDRLTFGFCRYGHIAESAKTCDIVKTLRDRVKKYEDTGNTEFLIDAANFCMIEFATQAIPRPTFGLLPVTSPLASSTPMAGDSRYEVARLHCRAVLQA